MIVDSSVDLYLCVCKRILDIDLYKNTKYRPYGAATVNRLLNIIGLFCRISSLLQGSIAKEPIILRILLIVATP